MGDRSPRHHGDEVLCECHDQEGGRRTLLRDSTECVVTPEIVDDKYNTEQSSGENECELERRSLCSWAEDELASCAHLIVLSP